jgi:CRP-like cAMP-binding protein
MRDVFSVLSDDSVRKLAGAMTERELPGGALLFIEGDEAHSVFRLLSGSVRLFRSSPDGREVTIRTVEPGELFAEMVLLETDRYPVSAVTMDTSIVAAIRCSRVRKLLEDGSFRNEFLRDVVGRVRYLSEQLYVHKTMDVRKRLLRFIVIQHGRYNQIDMDLRKSDVAAAISVRPETLSRAIRRLTDEGLISWKGRHLTVSDAAWDQL